MSDDADPNRDVRLMRQLIDELRAEPVPQLDWAAVERRVTERIAPTASWRRLWRSESASLVALRRATGFAAAAATVAFMVAANGPDDAALGVRSARPPSVVEGGASVASPRTGVTVVTQDEPRVVQVEGVGSWTLGPHSQAVVRRVGETYVVGLERGSVDAEVIPVAEERGMVESFAVEVGHTRVAVHGTVFSVTRLGDLVEVEVRRGTVAIGPTGHRGLTLGRLLVAPARAQFTLDGGRQARMLPMGERAVAVAARPSGLERPAAETPVAASDPPIDADSLGLAPPAGGGQGLPLRPPSEAVALDPEAEEPTVETAPTPEPPQPNEDPPALSAADARTAIAGCLAAFEEGAGGSGVRVTISTQVTLHRGAGDRIGSVQFSPPLRPDLQQRCASPLLGRRLSGADRTVSFPVVVAPR